MQTRQNAPTTRSAPPAGPVAGAISIAPADGTLLWKHEWPGDGIVQPAVIPGDGIGGAQLINQRVGIGNHFSLLSATRFGLCQKSEKPCAIQMRHRLGSEIMAHHLTSRMRRLPLGDELVGQRAGLALAGK